MSVLRTNLPAVVPAETIPLATYTSVEEEGSSPGMSLAQVVCIVRAYWKHSLAAFLILVFTFAFLIKLLPKSYVATATLIVNQGNKDPLASSDLANASQTFIPTQVELISSAVVLQPVIDQLGLMSDPQFTNGYHGSPAALREAVLTNLSKALSVFPGAGSDLLYISAASKRPDQAAAIANAVAAEYLKLNQQRTEQPAAQRAELYSQELAQLRDAAIEAQNKVTAFRQRHGMIDLASGSADEAETALDDLSQKLLAAQNDERNVEAQLMSESADAAPAGPNSAISPAGNLAAEEAQLAKLRASLGPRHPTVLALESEIAATKRAISTGLAAQLADARTLVEQYQAAVNTQRQLVLNRRRMQDEGAKLLLELESAEATYKRALDGYSQIEFASSDDFSDVTLVSRAEPPVRALKPDKLKYFLASCMLSLGLALGVPFAYELLVNRRLRCRDDLERHFGIPVLAQFGPLPRGRSG